MFWLLVLNKWVKDFLVELEVEMALASGAAWVSTPASITMMSQARSFPVRINTEGLKPGAYFTTVTGTDASDPARGALFSLPITVIVPVDGLSAATAMGSTPEVESTSSSSSSSSSSSMEGESLRFPLSLEGGKAARTFITTPSGADYATVKLASGDVSRGPHTVMLHCVPNARGDADACHDEAKRLLMLRPHAEVAVNVPVKADATLEVCVALSWLGNPEPIDVDAIVEFHSYGTIGAAAARDEVRSSE